MKIRHLLEDDVDREFFWESMQDHGWKPRGEFLVSPDDKRITVDFDGWMYYRNVNTKVQYTDTKYYELLSFEDDKEIQLKWCLKCRQMLIFACEEIKIAVTRKDGWAIKYIQDPSEAVQLASVQGDGFALQYIENPSEAVQIAAVQKTGWAIKYIEDPSEAVQLAAVQRDNHAISYIENPSEAVKLAAGNYVDGGRERRER